MAEEFEQVIHCQMCDNEFQVGRHIQEGHYVGRYQLHVCAKCYQCNEAGWAPLYEQKLMPLLISQGLAIPPRNALGLLPRD